MYKVNSHMILSQYFQHFHYFHIHSLFCINVKEANTLSIYRAIHTNPHIDKIIPRRKGMLICAL